MVESFTVNYRSESNFADKTLLRVRDPHVQCAIPQMLGVNNYFC